jgi:hypothetical protein
MSDISLATATTIYHKFFKNLSINEFDPYVISYSYCHKFKLDIIFRLIIYYITKLIATASIYLGCKIEEEKVKLRDIINVSYRTLHPDLPPLELNETYRLLRESVVQTELLIARKLAFKLEFEHPQKVISLAF